MQTLECRAADSHAELCSWTAEGGFPYGIYLNRDAYSNHSAPGWITKCVVCHYC
jgi:hypothetical protein